MKILHIITGLNTGGAERALCALLAGGLAERFNCAVLSLADEGSMGEPIRELGVPVHMLGIRAGASGPGSLLKLRRLVRQLRPDVIQGWMYHGNLAASVAACLAPDRPALAWNVRHCLYDLANERPLTRQVIRVNRALSRCPGAIIYNSRLSREQHERFGFAAERGVVVPNGFDLTRLRPDLEAGMAVRREFGLPLDVTVVGHVARFHPMKDHASFLRAAVRVARENSSAWFLLVGRDVSPENPALADIVPQGLLGRFVFVGERSDPHRLMQAMDVFCLSSWSEAFPNVLGEAMACGVPCVTTHVGDSADIIGNSGVVVPPYDSQALASGLQTMVRKSREKRRALGCAARARVKTHYGLDSVVRQYADLYRNIAGTER